MRHTDGIYAPPLLGRVTPFSTTFPALLEISCSRFLRCITFSRCRFRTAFRWRLFRAAAAAATDSASEAVIGGSAGSPALIILTFDEEDLERDDFDTSLESKRAELELEVCTSTRVRLLWGTSLVQVLGLTEGSVSDNLFGGVPEAGPTTNTTNQRTKHGDFVVKTQLAEQHRTELHPTGTCIQTKGPGCHALGSRVSLRRQEEKCKSVRSSERDRNIWFGRNVFIGAWEPEPIWDIEEKLRAIRDSEERPRTICTFTVHFMRLAHTPRATKLHTTLSTGQSCTVVQISLRYLRHGRWRRWSRCGFGWYSSTIACSRHRLIEGSHLFL